MAKEKKNVTNGANLESMKKAFVAGSNCDQGSDRYPNGKKRDTSCDGGSK